MNKKKLLIVISIIIVVIALSIATVIVIKNVNVEETPNNNDKNNGVKVSGKLEEYVKNLTDNYYIKYSGKFKNNQGNYVDAIVEYTKTSDKYALRSSEINMHLIYDGNKLYSIDDRYKMLISLGNNFNVSQYNLASDINQVFINSYKEKIGSVEYDVEEYLHEGKVLKYYFKENDVKLIRYDNIDIRIIRLEKNANKEMLMIPESYKKV